MAPAAKASLCKHHRSTNGVLRGAYRQKVAVLHAHKPARAGRRCVQVNAKVDYTASRNDAEVLQLPGRLELTPDEVINVFGYPRNLHDRYFVGKCIGAGSFGVVRECSDSQTGELFAIKTIPKCPKKGRPTPRYLLKLQQEVDAMQQLGASLDAVFLQDVFEDDADVHLVMEICTGGALLDRITESTTERQVARYIRSVMRFISQCHAKGVVYRDVKPDNFLFGSKDTDSALKATDFGLSIRHTAGEGALRSRSGTPAYMAPEVIMQNYNEKADVWSVGMLTYQLLTGRFPYTDNIRVCSLQQVWNSILNDDIDFDASWLKGKVSDEAISFLRRTLERNARSRITAAHALQHPWLQLEEELPDLPLAGSVVQRLQRYATYSRLKQIVLRMIVEDIATSAPDALEAQPLLNIIRDMFAQLDADRSGALSLEELTNGLRAQGYKLTQGEVAHLMERVDLNRDDSISFDELAAGLVDWDQLQKDETTWRAWCDRAFNKLDLDGDGFISYDELLSELSLECGESMDQETRAAEARRMLRDADSNDDGRISRNEFRSLLMNAGDALSQYDQRLPHVDAVDEELSSLENGLAR